MQEQLNQVWQWIAPYVTSATIQTIITTIFLCIFKAFLNKAVNRENIKSICKDSFDASTEKIKTTVFKHDIEPIVTSKLQEIDEKACAKIDDRLAKYQDIMKNQTMLIGQLLSYFDNSVGIPQDVKDKAKAQYEATLDMCDDKTPTPAVSVVEIEDKKHKGKEVSTPTIEIER